MNAKYAQFINNLILTSKEHIKDKNCDSLVMAINGIWGSGKTTFINDYIKRYENNDAYVIIKYDAWENDYWDNAFEPLIYNILYSNSLSSYSNGIKYSKILSNCIGSFIKGVVKTGLKKYVDEEILNRIESMLKSKDIKNISTNELFLEYKNFRDSLVEFKKILSDIQKDIGKKVVVFVDELDRCKPDFAIKTLEFIKHIFDCENFCFIYSVDYKQLSESMKTIYGVGMDTIGYLRRFFDYVSNLPSDKNEYIKNEIENRKLNDECKNFLFPLLLYKDYSYRDIQFFFISLDLFIDKVNNADNIERSYVLIFLIYLKTLEPNKLDEINNAKFVKKTSDNFLTNNKIIDKYLKKIVDMSIKYYTVANHLEEFCKVSSYGSTVIYKVVGIDDNKVMLKSSANSCETAYCNLLTIKDKLVYFDYEYIINNKELNKRVIDVMLEEIEIVDFINKV